MLPCMIFAEAITEHLTLFENAFGINFCRPGITTIPFVCGIVK